MRVIIACCALLALAASSNGGCGDAPACRVTGCTSQVCTDHDDVATHCAVLPEYACYRDATCERQPDGECGWTQTPELVQCIENARKQ